MLHHLDQHRFTWDKDVPLIAKQDTYGNRMLWKLCAVAEDSFHLWANDLHAINCQQFTPKYE